MAGGVLLYDPDCGFCTRAAGWVGKLGCECAVVPGLPATLRASGVDPDRARREIPFIDEHGRVTWGSDAVASALATGPLPTRLAARVLMARGVREVAQVVYRFVARHRHRLPGGTAVCAMPPAPDA